MIQNRIGLQFLVFLFIVGSSVSFHSINSAYATGEKKSHRGESQSSYEKPLLVKVVATPKREHRHAVLEMTPASQKLQKAIYLMHDADPSQDDFVFDKIDFKDEIVPYAEFERKTYDLFVRVKELKRSGRLHQFHRYIGIVSVSDQHPDRAAVNRFHEHVYTCNANDYSSEKRLCVGLRDSSSKSKKVRMTVLAHGIDESQIMAFEAIFISVFGGLEDFGWNSTPGNLTARDEYLRGHGIIDENFYKSSSPQKKLLFDF